MNLLSLNLWSCLGHWNCGIKVTRLVEEMTMRSRIMGQHKILVIDHLKVEKLTSQKLGLL